MRPPAGAGRRTWGSSTVAKVRVDLERGRKLRSSGDPEGALPLFEAAFSRAHDAGEHYLAGDAAHMCALAVSDDRAAMEEPTQRGLDLGDREPAAAYDQAGIAFAEDAVQTAREALD